MAWPHQMAHASGPLAWPSQLPAYLQAPAAKVKLLYCLTTTLTPQLMESSSHSLPPTSKGGSTTPLASLQMPLDSPPPTWSKQIGELAELRALPPTTQVPDPLSARLDGWMAPLPKSFGASTPLHSPHQFMPFESMGGEWHSPHHFVPFASTGGNVLHWLVVCSRQQGQLDMVAKG
jgi:hypothetical protein